MISARPIDVRAADVAAQEPCEFPAMLALGAGAVLTEHFAALDGEGAAVRPDVRVSLDLAGHGGMRCWWCWFAEDVRVRVGSEGVVCIQRTGRSCDCSDGEVKAAADSYAREDVVSVNVTCTICKADKMRRGRCAESGLC